MSHFSTIKTKLKDKSIIIEALNLMGERVNNPEDLGMSVVDLVITNPAYPSSILTIFSITIS